MKKAMMFVVGALLIAVLGSMSVPAETSADYDEFRDGPKHRGQFLEVEQPSTYESNYDLDLLYVDSNGGIITDCGGECPWPDPDNGSGKINLQ